MEEVAVVLDKERKVEMEEREIGIIFHDEEQIEEDLSLTTTQEVLHLGQGLLSLLLLIIFVFNFLKNSGYLAPSYAALSLYWAYSAIRSEVGYRLTKSKKHRVYGFFFLMFSALFIFLFITKF